MLVTAQLLSLMWSFFVHAKRFSTVGVKMAIPSSLSTVGSVNILLPLPTELEPDLNEHILICSSISYFCTLSHEPDLARCP